MIANKHGLTYMKNFFELIQVVLGTRQELSTIPSSQEWKAVYDEAVRQAVAGICIDGINRLSKEQMPPRLLLLEWIGLAEQIRQQNKHVDEQTAEIWKRLKEDGLNAAILKGQGIATLYDVRCAKEDTGCGRLSELRQSGDIDIWVKGGYQKVCDYVQKTRPTTDVAYHRFHYDYFDDTEVELHHRPTLMRNLIDDRKLARWYNSFGADSFVYLEDKGFAVPPVEFNRIFILTHIYRHFLFKGIGLRQVIDYFFVLKANGGREREKVGDILKELRLTRFAEAIMWILHEVLGLEEQYLICDTNEKEGRFVLSEIEQTGNFGYGDTRFGGMSKLRRMTKHGIHLLLHYPSEVIWTPIWLIYHKVWRWNKVRKIHGGSSHI
jgi:hypothetical protein